MFLHFLKLAAASTGLDGCGQENDKCDSFPSCKKTIHTQDRRYCLSFIQRKPLVSFFVLLLICRTVLTSLHLLNVGSRSGGGVREGAGVLVCVPNRNVIGRQFCTFIGFRGKSPTWIQVRKNQKSRTSCVHTHRISRGDVLPEENLCRFCCCGQQMYDSS